jgi:hypothetical protein
VLTGSCLHGAVLPRPHDLSGQLAKLVGCDPGGLAACDALAGLGFAAGHRYVPLSQPGHRERGAWPSRHARCAARVGRVLHVCVAYNMTRGIPHIPYTCCHITNGAQVKDDPTQLCPYCKCDWSGLGSLKCTGTDDPRCQDPVRVRSWVGGSGWVGSGRVGSGRVGSGRVMCVICAGDAHTSAGADALAHNAHAHAGTHASARRPHARTHSEPERQAAAAVAEREHRRAAGVQHRRRKGRAGLVRREEGVLSEVRPHTHTHTYTHLASNVAPSPIVV